jgi:hypothetical protein
MKHLLSLSFLFLLLLFAVTNTYCQTITTIAGGGTGTADGIPATSSYMLQPYAVAQSYDGRIHFNDGFYYGTRLIDNNALMWKFSGTGVLGYSGDGGPATAADFTMVRKCAVDKWGRVYIAVGNRIRRVDTNGIITLWAGTGISGYSGDGGPATAAEFGMPIGLALDTIGNLYFSTTFYIKKITPSGIITHYAGGLTPGFSGDGGPATAAQFNNILELSADLSGNLYLIDAGNFRVRKINSAGVVSTVAGNGSLTYTGDGGPATAAGLGSAPMGVAWSSGYIYVAQRNENVIRQIDPSGIKTTIAGTGAVGYSGDGGPATAATFNGSRNLSRHGGGPLLVCEAGNSVIRKIDLPNNPVYFTQGSTVAVTVCGGELHTIDTLLRVFDADDQQPLTWSIAQQPAHGVLAAWHWAVSDMGVKTPVGTSYAPHTGYYGTDTFKVRITDGGTPDTITIAVTIEAFPTPAVLTGPDTLCIGESVPFTASATGVWSVPSSTATVSSGGVVTGVSTGTAVVSYGVTNVCGTAWAAKVVTIMGPPYCNTGVASVAPSGFTLSPNPSTGTFTVQLPQGGTALATLTDVAGRTVGTHVVSHNTPIHSALPPGIYILHVTTPTGSWRSKLVIQ